MSRSRISVLAYTKENNLIFSAGGSLIYDHGWNTLNSVAAFFNAVEQSIRGKAYCTVVSPTTISDPDRVSAET